MFLWALALTTLFAAGLLLDGAIAVKSRGSFFQGADYQKTSKGTEGDGAPPPNTHQQLPILPVLQ
jgi:hypothetical protein